MGNENPTNNSKLPLIANLSRRDLLRLGAMTGAGMALGDLWFVPALDYSPKKGAKAK